MLVPSYLPTLFAGGKSEGNSLFIQMGVNALRFQVVVLPCWQGVEAPFD